jgi:hypothetical protein
MIDHQGSWRLPVVKVERQGWFASKAAAVSRGVRESYGLEVTVLRHLLETADVHCCELELQSKRGIDQLNTRWVDRRKFHKVAGLSKQLQRACDRWFLGAARRKLPALRAPWERRGWFRQAHEWIDGHLEALGLQLVKPVEQFKAAWSNSCLLLVPTDRGELFFKAAYDKPPGEAALTLALAEVWPRHTVEVLASDVQRNWMLTADLGERLLEGMPDRFYEGAARSFATLQLQSLDSMDRWTGLGCTRMGLVEMVGFLDSIPEMSAELSGGKNALDEAELERLLHSLPALKAKSEELMGFSLPLTLHQQDFRAGNVYVRGDDYVFLDWADTMISHPFLSASRMMQEIGLRAIGKGGGRGGDEAVNQATQSLRLKVRGAYLEAFRGLVPPADLERAMDLAVALNPLDQMVKWQAEYEWAEAGTPWIDNVLYYKQYTARAMLTGSR